MQNNIDIIIDNRGTFSESENIYLQMDEAENVVDLTDEFNERPTEEQVESYLNSLIGKELDTASKPLQIMVTEENKGHIKGTNVKIKGAQSVRHNTALTKLKDVVSNAIVDEDKDGTVDLSHNTKQETINHKKGIEKYVYFNSKIKIGKEYFTVELHSELPKSRKNKNLYDLYHVRVRRNLPAASNDTLQSGGSHNYNISQSDTNVKSFSQVKGLPKGENENKPQTVHLYNIKEVLASSSKTTIKKQETPLNTIITPSDTNVKYPKQLDAKIHMKIELNIKKNVH